MNATTRAPHWIDYSQHALLQQPSSATGDFRVSGLSRERSAQLADMVPAHLVRAAVLVALVDRSPDPTVLLTVRASALNLHGGHVSFVGGKLEDADVDARMAAVREAFEEIGLPAESIRVLGYLPDHVLIESRFVVTPVVAIVAADAALQPNPSEVAEAFEVPLHVVFDQRNWVPRVRRLGVHELPVFDIVAAGRTISGATAGMLVTLRNHLDLPSTVAWSRVSAAD